MTAKDRILARRAKFIAAAVVSVAGCSSSATPVTEADAQPCLSQAIDSGRDTRDATDGGDTEPTVCLSAPLDSSTDDADTTVDDAADAEPMPCLKMPPPDGG